MRIPFGTWPWRPDQAAINAQVLADVRNAIQTSGGWQPQKAGAAIATQTITGPIQGLTTATRLDGTIEVFVAANGAVWRIPGRSAALQSVAEDYYSYAAFDATPTTRWRWVQMGDLLLGTNYTNHMQGYNLTSGGLFTRLSTQAPKAKYLAMVRDFPVVAFTNDEFGEDAYQVRWPGLVDGVVDPTEWDLDPVGPATQADFQKVSDIGQITGLTGGQFGTIIGESGVAIMQYGGSLFTFDVRERKIGCRVPESVQQYRQSTYFWSPDGFQSFDGQQCAPIGAEKVDRWFAADFDESARHLMWTSIDSARGHVLWLYPGQGHTGKANRLLRYSPLMNEFVGLSDIEADAIGPGKTFGGDLDDIEQFPDLDANDINLDDPALWDSFPQTIMVQNAKLAAFVGAPLTGSWETAPLQATPDGRAILNKALVIHEGGAPTLRVGTGEQFGNGTNWGNIHPQQSDGYLRFREPGRTHKLRVSLSGAWSKAEAIDVYAAPVGSR